MGRAFSDDLRTRIGAADERGEGSCRVLAKRFGVSWEYVRKVRQQRRQNNSRARRPQSRYGVPSRMSESVKDYMLDLVEVQDQRSLLRRRWQPGSRSLDPQNV
jgi:transposase